MATYLPRMDYEYLNAKLGGRKEVKVTHNTYAARTLGGCIEVRLHGNLIATLYPNGCVYLSDGGWPTQTTARRLRALAPAGYTVYIHDGYIWLARAGAGDGLPIIGGVNLTSDSR